MNIDEFKLWLDSADVPEMRRDITEGWHVRWLLRNLQFRNADKEGFCEAIAFLRKHVRQFN